MKATASYDTSGSAVLNVTTKAAPDAEFEGEEEVELAMITGLFTTTSGCSSSVSSVLNFSFAPEALMMVNAYTEPTAIGILGNFQSFLTGSLPAAVFDVAKTVSGTTTTLSGSSGELAGKPFNCAFVLTESVEATEEGEEPEEPALAEFMFFPVVGPPTPPASASTTPPAAAPAPAPAPAALSIAKSKPLTLKVGKWKTVQVKVTNTGGTATAVGTLRVKPTKGVLVKPASQKLPTLTPGASWSVPVQVKLTKKAKKTSTLALSGVAAGAGAKGSLVVKLAG